MANAPRLNYASGWCDKDGQAADPACSFYEVTQSGLTVFCNGTARPLDGAPACSFAPGLNGKGEDRFGLVQSYPTLPFGLRPGFRRTSYCLTGEWKVGEADDWQCHGPSITAYAHPGTTAQIPNVGPCSIDPLRSFLSWQPSETGFPGNYVPGQHPTPLGCRYFVPSPPASTTIRTTPENTAALATSQGGTKWAQDGQPDPRALALVWNDGTRAETHYCTSDWVRDPWTCNGGTISVVATAEPG
jgi:hypothetical protein